MKTVRLIVRGNPVGGLVLVATTHAERMRGLLGRASLPIDHAMLLSPCRAIHTWGMQFAIDVVFLDADNRVTRTVAGVKPWRWVWGSLRTKATLEFSAGWLARSLLAPGDAIAFSAEVNGEVEPERLAADC